VALVVYLEIAKPLQNTYNKAPHRSFILGETTNYKLEMDRVALLEFEAYLIERLKYLETPECREKFSKEEREKELKLLTEEFRSVLKEKDRLPPSPQTIDPLYTSVDLTKVCETTTNLYK
jgi:hypothetical protein